jgi:SpoVK/Ycf46/Vps4 family AAA+-type ATPase
MRTGVRLAALLTLSLMIVPVCAFSSDNKIPDEEQIDALEAKADQAQPREQCFLYAQLVQQMTELSARQYAAGDVAKADGMLKKIQQFAQKIHLSLAANDKRLKHAQILLSNTAFRLKELLHSSDYDDRPLVEKTLAQVNQAQNEAMMQVFSK